MAAPGAAPAYRRVLLKISGEALAGGQGYGIDPDVIGRIAEEVAEVYPNLVGRNREGLPESVRYEQINAMLLNEFLKEHKKNQEQEVTIARQRKDFEEALAQQQKQIESLTAGLQKMSAQLEASKPAPHMVNNP